MDLYIKYVWAAVFPPVLPGNHLCAVDALRLPGDADGLLRAVQVLQQHADHVVPVLGTLIRLRSVFIPGAHGTLCIRVFSNGCPPRQITDAHTKDLLAVRFLGFSVLQVDLGRGDVCEQLPDLCPTVTGSGVVNMRRGAGSSLCGGGFSSPVLAANVDGCGLVVILSFFIELSGFRELLEEREE